MDGPQPNHCAYVSMSEKHLHSRALVLCFSSVFISSLLLHFLNLLLFFFYLLFVLESFFVLLFTSFSPCFISFFLVHFGSLRNLSLRKAEFSCAIALEKDGVTRFFASCAQTEIWGVKCAAEWQSALVFFLRKLATHRENETRKETSRLSQL